MRWLPEERESVESAVAWLREKAASYRLWNRRGPEMQCRHCSNWFSSSEGRWLVGWEGWWLCSDCIVGYVFSDEAPEAPSCAACSGSTSGGCWSWEQGQPQWLCGVCSGPGPTCVRDTSSLAPVGQAPWQLPATPSARSPTSPCAGTTTGAPTGGTPAVETMDLFAADTAVGPVATLVAAGAVAQGSEHRPSGVTSGHRTPNGRCGRGEQQLPRQFVRTACSA